MCDPDNKVKDCTTTSSKAPEQSDDETIDCPLFMEGLPKDFQSNPHLAAIASLLEDGDPSTSQETKTPEAFRSNPLFPSTSRGTKARAKSRSLRRVAISSPYPPPSTTSPTKTPSLGEAQLFLKMWKLS